MKWMVIDLKTGMIQGFYANRKDAETQCGVVNANGGIGAVRPL